MMQMSVDNNVAQITSVVLSCACWRKN